MMKGRGIVWILIVIFSVTISVAVAGNKNGGSPGGKQGAGGNDTAQNSPVRDRDRDKENDCDNEPIQLRDRDRDRDRDNTAEEPGPGYQTQDGVVHVWDDRFTPRMKQYADQDNREAMNRYLNWIVKRYRFKDQKDTDGFVQWSLENRPWDVN